MKNINKKFKDASDQYESKKESLKQCENAIERDNKYGSFETIGHGAIICCQEINLYQNSDVLDKEEKIIGLRSEIFDREETLSHFRKKLETDNDSLGVKIIDETLDRIMDAKHVWQV